jgi:hypothetical protein
MIKHIKKVKFKWKLYKWKKHETSRKVNIKMLNMDITNSQIMEYNFGQQRNLCARAANAALRLLVYKLICAILYFFPFLTACFIKNSNFFWAGSEDRSRIEWAELGLCCSDDKKSIHYPTTNFTYSLSAVLKNEIWIWNISLHIFLFLIFRQWYSRSSSSSGSTRAH